jgi:hypothetical protein
MRRVVAAVVLFGGVLIGAAGCTPPAGPTATTTTSPATTTTTTAELSLGACLVERDLIVTSWSEYYFSHGETAWTGTIADLIGHPPVYFGGGLPVGGVPRTARTTTAVPTADCTDIRAAEVA